MIMSFSAAKIVKIIEQAKDKRFTYLTLTLPNGMEIRTCINKLMVNSIDEESIYINGEKEWAEIASIGLKDIYCIDERKPDIFELEDAEAEYIIKYSDGSELFVQIYNKEE